MNNLVKFSSKSYECYQLDWDTEYFGIKSARVNLKESITKEDQNKILEYCEKFEFTTISNSGNNNENNYWIGKNTNAFLADINIQFIKNLRQATNSNDGNTQTYNSYQLNQQVLKIAGSTFNYSRFFNDPLLPKEQAKDIYLHWTKCAFEQVGKYFVITKRNEDIAGYLLFSMDSENTIATIELIATDSKYRGYGVGKSLIFELESFLSGKEVFSIKVGTQIDNIQATQFYISSGFKYVSCSSIYHLWTNK